MFKNQIKLNLMIILALGLFIASCSKEDLGVDVENYGFVESYTIQKNLNAGIHGCVELVFPVSVELPDGTILEFDSFEDGKAQLQAWREANPDVTGKPQVIFPVEIITQDGEVVSVESRDEIKALVKDCRSQFPPRPRHFRPCFKVVYPVTVAFPDGTETEIDSRMALKQLLRNWKKDNPDAQERPELVYPITIEYEDGTTQEIADHQALVAAKRDCRDQ